MLTDSFISAFVPTITYKACFSFLFTFLFLHCICTVTVHFLESASVPQIWTILYNPTTFCVYIDFLFSECWRSCLFLFSSSCSYDLYENCSHCWTWADEQGLKLSLCSSHNWWGFRVPGCLTCGGNILMEVSLWDASDNWWSFGAWLPYL